MPLLVVFIVLSAGETFILDLIFRRWFWVRIPVLVLSIWGVVWMVGMLCAHLARPHTVGPGGLRVRNGLDWDVHVAWDDVYSVELHKYVYEPKSPKLFDEDGHRILRYAVGSEANIEIVLERPTTITLPGLSPTGGEQIVDGLRLWTDDPKGYLRAVREYIGPQAEETASKKT